MSSSPQSLTSHRSPSPVPLAPSTETVPPPAMEHGVAKVFGCGVMRGEVRIGQASSPPGFDEAGRPTVQNLKRWIGPVHRDRRGSRPFTASSSPNLGKEKVATTDCLGDRAFGQLSGTADRCKAQGSFTRQRPLGCSAYAPYPDHVHVLEWPRY